MKIQNPDTRIIMGIDPGTAKMGCCILIFTPKSPKKPSTIKLIDSMLIETSSDLDAPRRLRILYNKLTQIAKEYNPTTMSIERIFFNTNVKTAMSVGQARGVALLVSAQHKMEVFEYTALEAKMVITGYGRADKKQMQEEVKKLLKLSDKIKSDDANDAVAMAICHVKKFYSDAPRPFPRKLEK